MTFHNDVSQIARGRAKSSEIMNVSYDISEADWRLTLYLTELGNKWTWNTVSKIMNLMFDSRIAHD